MAGSMVWRSYTSDDGTEYAAWVDESNAEAAGGFGVSVDGLPLLPKRLKMRYINTVSTGTPPVKRKFYVGNTLTFNTYVGRTTTQINGKQYPNDAADTIWKITSTRGEKTTFATSVDTGFNDGDNP